MLEGRRNVPGGGGDRRSEGEKGAAGAGGEDERGEQPRQGMDALGWDRWRIPNLFSCVSKSTRDLGRSRCARYCTTRLAMARKNPGSKARRVTPFSRANALERERETHHV